MVSIPRSIGPVKMSRRNRLIVYYVAGIVLLVLVLTLLYNYGMRNVEGREHTLFQSFQTVTETMTTTGYGGDSLWQTPVMNAFVALMQILGIGIGFFTLRLVIIPLFEEAEVNLDNRLAHKEDHVVVCEYRRDSEVLLDELRELGIDYVLVSSDRDEAVQLSNDGYAAIHGSPQEVSSFDRAAIDRARAVITDAETANVDTILTARTARPDVPIIALTDDDDLRDVLTVSGADSVLSPHAATGRRLAEKAVSSFTTENGDSVELGGDIEVAEIPVQHDSELLGVRIRDSRIRERTGANVIGAWIDGELQLPPDPDAVIRQNTVLLVTGGSEDIAELSEFTRSPRSFRRHNRIVLAGTGAVGGAARPVVEEAGIDVTSIDVEDGEGVDVVGDAASRAVLQEAGIEDADAILVGLPDDSPALLTTVLAREINPDVEVLVRINRTDNAGKAMRAGADYVLSVPRVSARMVARELRGEDVLEPATQIRLVRVSGEPFAGSRVADAGIYERTGCRVIAIEDESGLTTTVDPGHRIEPDDSLTVVGSDEAIQRFTRKFDVSPAEPVS